MYRSLLFIPADSDKKIAKAESIPADLIILDLEDAVAAEARPEAREKALRYLKSPRRDGGSARFIRVNPADSDDFEKDLEAVMAGAPDGIVLPKAHAPDDILVLGARLSKYENALRLEARSTRILPVATETPKALFSLGEYAKVNERLAGLTWGAEDLGAAVGALSKKGEAGEWSDPFALARSLCLFAASSAGVPAIDTLYADFRDDEGLAASARRARRDGFTGKLAIHPAQVETINAAFTPEPEEIAEAQAIIDLFAANPRAGALSYKGRMVDWPHLVQARKIVALAERAGN
ncbi:MAG: CoA ester lyase [Pseudomonadota bacterium]